HPSDDPAGRPRPTPSAHPGSTHDRRGRDPDGPPGRSAPDRTTGRIRPRKPAPTRPSETSADGPGRPERRPAPAGPPSTPGRVLHEEHLDRGQVLIVVGAQRL